MEPGLVTGELLGRLAVKCFVDDNYTYQQCVPAWWLAAGGAGAAGESEAVAVWIYPGSRVS